MLTLLAGSSLSAAYAVPLEGDKYTQLRAAIPATAVNVTGVGFSVVFTTDTNAKTSLRVFGPNGQVPSSGSSEAIERKSLDNSTIHFFDVVGLRQGASYAYEAVIDEVATGVVLAVTLPDTPSSPPGVVPVTGVVRNSDDTAGVGPALVIYKLVDADGVGSPLESALWATLTANSGVWAADVGGVRTRDYQTLFAATSGDNIAIDVRAGALGSVSATVKYGDAIKVGSIARILIGGTTVLITATATRTIILTHTPTPASPTATQTPVVLTPTPTHTLVPGQPTPAATLTRAPQVVVATDTPSPPASSPTLGSPAPSATVQPGETTPSLQPKDQPATPTAISPALRPSLQRSPTVLRAGTQVVEKEPPPSPTAPAAGRPAPGRTGIPAALVPTMTPAEVGLPADAPPVGALAIIGGALAIAGLALAVFGMWRQRRYLR